jgi:hypothetical protein
MKEWPPIYDQRSCILSGAMIKYNDPVLGSIPASSDTVESEGRQMKQC